MSYEDAVSVLNQMQVAGINAYQAFIQDLETEHQKFLDNSKLDLEKVKNNGIYQYNNKKDVPTKNGEQFRQLDKIPETDSANEDEMVETDEKSSKASSVKSQPSINGMQIGDKRMPSSEVVNTISVAIKQELIDMPPPAKPLTRKNRKRINTYSDSDDLNSDVVIHSEKLDTVTVNSSDDEDLEARPKRGRPRTKRKNANENNNTESTRSTRSNMRNTNKNQMPETTPKRIHSNTPPKEEGKSTKRAKTTRGNKQTDSNSTFVADIVIKKEKTSIKLAPQLLNETIVLSKPTIVTKENHILDNVVSPDYAHLMTDDDETIYGSSPKPKAVKKSKQVFSPYGNSPVKKRVEAFEKLGAELNTDLPVRMTRTKTKAKEESQVNPNNKENTPHASGIPTAKGAKLKSNIGAAKTQIQKDSSVSTTTLVLKSNVKASQVEFQERELRRQQKESEALLKKEALIQQQTEERRRKREEKQLKARQARDAMEKQKQQALEVAERQKQQRMKQLLAEKEEKIAKQKEEAARIGAGIKEKERRRQIETSKMKLPLYLEYEAPLLPTDDCYDSDDAKYDKNVSKCRWEDRKVLSHSLMWTRYIEPFRKSLYCQVQTVNLQELFPSIEPSKLKRTSSAVWNQSKLTTLAEDSGSDTN